MGILAVVFVRCYYKAMSKRTHDYEHERYSPEVIRRYEDPEYARRAEAYEREQRRKLKKRSGKFGRGSDAPENSHLNKPPKRKNYRINKLKMVRNILLILVVMAVAIFAYVLSITSNLDRVDTTGKNFAINSQVDKDLDGYRNIAILGSDARKGEGYDGSRTDAIIILSIRKRNGHIRMISVMRDSYLKMKGSSGDMVLDKLTHAHAFGGGVNTISALNRSLDLNIREYVVFNWKTVADTIDTLGGITVDVKSNEIGDLNHWGPETGENVGHPYKKIKKTGVQTIDGVQATTYCRIRKNSGGDKGRANRYKKVMAGVLKKSATSPWKFGELSKKVMPKVRTNMTQFQVATLLLRTPTFDMGKSISYPKSYYGGIIGGVWYAVPTTLNNNARWLHRKAFEQKNYTPSATLSGINDEIINTTGVSAGNN